MYKIIPCFYSEYGRYIAKLRAIPFYIDCLKPVERRILLSLHDVARDRKVKSAKVVGHCIGNYHGHGDQSAYGTLVNMVHAGFAEGQGNWGSPGMVEDSTAASMRYTEVRLQKWVKEIAFKYYKFVPWEEIEMDAEPLYLPCPVPIGLIGEGVIQGISFHRTLIPKYKFSDLVKRCIHLIENKDPSECVITPNITGCQTTQEGKTDYYDILSKGEGTLLIIPNGNIAKKYIEILGRSPFKSFKSLIKAAEKDKKTKKKKLPIFLDDLCDENINIRVTPEKPKLTDLNQLAQEIWTKYLISKTKFTCLLCDKDGMTKQFGVDEIIKNSYHFWTVAVLNKKINDFNKINEKKFENQIIKIIRYIFEKHQTHKIEDIIKYYKQLSNNQNQKVELDYYDVQNKKWIKIEGEIEPDDIISVCKKKNIRSLIEQKIDDQKINQEIKNCINSINDNQIECFNELKSYV